MSTFQRLQSLLTVLLLGLLAFAIISASGIGMIVFFIGGFGFASAGFIALSVLCAAILIFSIFVSVRVLIPLGTTILGNE